MYQRAAAKPMAFFVMDKTVSYQFRLDEGEIKTGSQIASEDQ
jgi:hypothetical protein